jgi:hypothetical protein
VHQILLRTEVPFCRLNRRVSKEQLDLLKLAARHNFAKDLEQIWVGLDLVHTGERQAA